jgi:hypothetical protein
MMCRIRSPPPNVTLPRLVSGPCPADHPHSSQELVRVGLSQKLLVRDWMERRRGCGAVNLCRARHGADSMSECFAAYGHVYVLPEALPIGGKCVLEGNHGHRPE